MEIRYSNVKDEVDSLIIEDFYQGWTHKPSMEVLLQSIKNATYVTLAIDTDTNTLVGYITAVSDLVLSAYIPFLEVVPMYQKQGIGHTLVVEMLEQLKHLYMIDVICDSDLIQFYTTAGFTSHNGMIKRHYSNQAGPIGTHLEKTNPA